MFLWLWPDSAEATGAIAGQLDMDFSWRQASAREAKLFTNREGRGWISRAEFSAANVSPVPGQSVEDREDAGMEGR